MTEEDLTPSPEKTPEAAPAAEKPVASAPKAEGESGAPQEEAPKKKVARKRSAAKKPLAKLAGEVLTPKSKKEGAAEAPAETVEKSEAPKSEAKPAPAKKEAAPAEGAEAPKDNEEAPRSEGGERRTRTRNRRGARANRENREERPQQQPAREASGHCPNEMSAMAWELFSNEIEEDGMDIVKDKDGLKFARRSFELAKIFLDERARQGVTVTEPTRPRE